MPFHFDDMFHAFITVFVIITLDNWTNIMFPIMNVSLQHPQHRSCHHHSLIALWADAMYSWIQT